MFVFLSFLRGGGFGLVGWVRFGSSRVPVSRPCLASPGGPIYRLTVLVPVIRGRKRTGTGIVSEKRSLFARVLWLDGILSGECGRWRSFVRTGRVGVSSFEFEIWLGSAFSTCAAPVDQVGNLNANGESVGEGEEGGLFDLDRTGRGTGAL